MEGETPEAARQAFVITNLHWGLHAWSIYGCCALVIAYFTFRLGTAVDDLDAHTGWFQECIQQTDLKGWVNSRYPRGHRRDFRSCRLVGHGHIDGASGMSSVFGTDNTSNTISFAILAVMTVSFLAIGVTGVEKGSKYLSNINMVVAIIILLVVLFGGPRLICFRSLLTPSATI